LLLSLSLSLLVFRRHPERSEGPPYLLLLLLLLLPLLLFLLLFLLLLLLLPLSLPLSFWLSSRRGSASSFAVAQSHKNPVILERSEGPLYWFLLLLLLSFSHTFSQCSCSYF